MRILHVIDALTYEMGGTSAVAHALARCQSDAGHAVTVLTTDKGARRGEHVMALPSAVRKISGHVTGPDKVAFVRGFAELARQQLSECDIAHVHTVFNYPAHTALSVAADMRVPVVCSPHGMLQPVMVRHRRLSALKKATYLSLWGRRLLRACSAWHYTSTNERDASWPHGGQRHFVLELGLDPADYARDRALARAAVALRWPLIGTAPYVLFLGRLHPKKNPRLLVEAFLAGAPRGYRLVLAGPDQCGLWTAMQRALSATDVARVVATGSVIGTDKLDLYAGAALFALPSINENFGLTALEALAAGTPVLSSPFVDLAADAAQAGLAETLPLDTNKWAERLSRLSEAPEPSDEYIHAARAWVESRYSWTRIARRFVDRYEWVAAGCPAEAIVS